MTDGAPGSHPVESEPWSRMVTASTILQIRHQGWCDLGFGDTTIFRHEETLSYKVLEEEVSAEWMDRVPETLIATGGLELDMQDDSASSNE
jgi:hypothetical protein